MTFQDRNRQGSEAEQLFKRWVYAQAGWHVEPYGQGLMTERSRQMMRETPFNGDATVLHEMIASLRSDERNVYLDRIATVPNLTRWMPDFVLAYRNQIICAPDVKTSVTNSPNWAVEISSVLGNKMHSKTGVQCIYVFPPTPFVDYWSCASPDLLRERASRILDGRSVKGGSGTPFYLVPKRAIDLPLKQVMTGIDVSGSYAIVSRYGTLIL